MDLLIFKTAPHPSSPHRGCTVVAATTIEPPKTYVLWRRRLPHILPHGMGDTYGVGPVEHTHIFAIDFLKKILLSHHRGPTPFGLSNTCKNYSLLLI